MNIQLYKLGRRYQVLTLPIGIPFPMHKDNTLTLDNWEGFKGDLPILSPVSTDEDFILMTNGEHGGSHAHIDWRFLPEDWYFKFKVRFWREGLIGQTISFKAYEEYVPYIKPVMKVLECQREMPCSVKHFKADYLPELEDKYKCAALRNGKCPHRGTPARAMLDDGLGNLVCPSHGLRWNKKDDRLVPRITQKENVND